MKKNLQKRWVSILLVCIFVLGTALPIMAADAPTDLLYSSGREHSYDTGLVDGAVYCLKNVYDNTYMDVYGAATTNGTTVFTHPYHGALNQQFRLFYLGKGLYEIIPVHAGTRLAVNSQGALIIDAKNRTSNQIFKIKMVNSTTGVILSESSNYNKALCYDSNGVTEKTYSTLGTPTQAQWVFERVGTAADLYRTYHVRNCDTGLYLEVYLNRITNGASVYGRDYTSDANQEWLVRYNGSTDSYTLHPGHRRDLALDYTDSNAAVRYEGNIATQGLVLVDSGETDAHGRVKYKIQIEGVTGSQYLNIGENKSYEDNRYGVEKGYDASDYWVFEEVVVDTKTTTLLEVNQWQVDSVVSNYGETKWFSFAVNGSARYKIELTGAAVLLGTVQGAVLPNELDRIEDYRALDIIDIFLYGGGTATDTGGAEAETKCVYYIPVLFDATKGSAEQSFSIRIRQLSFVGHSDDDYGPTNESSNDLIMSQDIDDIEDSVRAMNMYFTHKEEITVSEAQTSTDPLTNYRDFNADMFVYAGHGAGGEADYEVKYVYEEVEKEKWDWVRYAVESERFYSDYLPADMQNCELIVWNCCDSAVAGKRDKIELDSLGNASITNGAKTVIAFSNPIATQCANVFIDKLFEELSKGKTVAEAVSIAKDAVEVWGDSVITVPRNDATKAAAEFIASVNILGDETNVIFPINAVTTVSVDNTIIRTGQAVNVSVLKESYTLAAESSAAGVKKYVKMINDIPTDDYFVELYQNGALVKVYQSSNTVTADEMTAATAQLTEMCSVNSMESTNSSIEEIQLIFKHINGELRLLRVETVIDTSVASQIRVIYYDAITNEVIVW